MDLFTEKKQTDRLREGAQGFQGERVGVRNKLGELETDMHMLLYLSWITRDFPEVKNPLKQET